MLLKMCSVVNTTASSLSLYDIRGTPGVAADLSHIDTPLSVAGYQGDDQLGAALKDADIVIIPAGVPRKPGMTRDDLFNTNASIVASLAKAITVHCPKAATLIIANPVNSTVPITAQIFTNAGTYDPRKLFGVTTLDVVRAQAFVGQLKKIDSRAVKVPVVGGHAGKTILPLFSQATYQGSPVSFTEAVLGPVTPRVQFGGDEVVQAKDGAGSATLSMAYAAYKFATSLLKAKAGDTNQVECAFVESKLTPARFFASPVQLGPNGVEKILPLDFKNAPKAEQDGLDAALKELLPQIQKGFDFVNAHK
jgi:malate dehydrogenase